MKTFIVFCVLASTSLASVIPVKQECNLKRSFERDYEILTTQIVRVERGDVTEFIVDKMKDDCILETTHLQEPTIAKIYKRLHDTIASYRREFESSKVQYEFLLKTLENWFPDLVEFHIMFVKYLRIKSVHLLPNYQKAISSKEGYISFAKEYLQKLSVESPIVFAKFRLNRIVQAYSLVETDKSGTNHFERYVTQASSQSENVVSVETYYEITIITIKVLEVMKKLPANVPSTNPSQQDFEKILAQINTWYPKTADFNSKFVVFLQTLNLSLEKLNLLTKDKTFYEVFCQQYINEFEKQNIAEIDKTLSVLTHEYIKTYFKQYLPSFEKIYESFKTTYPQNSQLPLGLYIYDQTKLHSLIQPIIAEFSYESELKNLEKNLNTWYPASFELNKAFLSFLKDQKISIITLKEITNPDTFLNALKASLKEQLTEFCSKYRREISDDLVRIIRNILITHHKDIQKSHEEIIKQMLKTDLNDLAFLIAHIYNEKSLIEIMKPKIEEVNKKNQLSMTSNLITTWYPEGSDFNRRIIEYFVVNNIDIKIIQDMKTKENLEAYLKANIDQLNKNQKVIQEVNQKIESLIKTQYTYIVEYVTEIVTDFKKIHTPGPMIFIKDIDNQKLVDQGIQPVVFEFGLKNLLKNLNVWFSFSPQLNQKFVDYLKMQKVPNQLIQSCTSVETFTTATAPHIKSFVTANQVEVNKFIVEAVQQYYSGRESTDLINKLIAELQATHLKNMDFVNMIIFNQINFGNEISKVMNQIKFQSDKEALKAKITEWITASTKEPKVSSTIVDIIVDNGLPVNIATHAELVQILRRPGIKVSESQLAVCKTEINKFIDIKIKELIETGPSQYAAIMPYIQNYFAKNNFYQPSYLIDHESITSKLKTLQPAIANFLNMIVPMNNFENELNTLLKENSKDLVKLIITFISNNAATDKNFMPLTVLENFVKNPKLILAKENNYLIELKKVHEVEYNKIIYNLIQAQLTKISPTESMKCFEKLKASKFVDGFSLQSLTDEKTFNMSVMNVLTIIKVKECAPGARQKITKFLNDERARKEVVDYFDSNPCVIEELCDQEIPLNDNQINEILKSYKEYASSQCDSTCGSKSETTQISEVFVKLLGSESRCMFDKMKRLGKIDTHFILKVINQDKLKTEFNQFSEVQQQSSKKVSCS